MKMSIIKSTAAALAVIATIGLASAPAEAAGDAPKPPKRDWSFSGLFGTFDRGATQRGFQVYKEVCAACHSLRLVSYRNLTGIGFSEDQIKAIAAEFEVTDGPNDEGEMFTRPAIPADKFVSPYPNDQAAAAANNGKVPPDLSLMTKARKGGADYVHALLTGYLEEAPEGFEMPEDGNYNTYFPGHVIAMAAPLSAESVEYADGTKPTLDQHAHDVTTFMAWAAEPELEERKAMGIKVLLFLLVLTGMMYAVKRRVWADQH